MASNKNNPKAQTNKKQAEKKSTTQKATVSKKTTAVKKTTTKQQSSIAAKATEPTFTLPTEHKILKEVGSRMILELQKQMQPTSFTIPLAVNFNRNIFESFLEIASTEGIRIYFSLDENAQLTPIITGIDSEGNDIYITTKSATDIYVGDMGQACPLYDASKIQLP
jgi:hypothetical protein